MMCRFSDKAKQTWNLHVNCHRHLALKCNTEYNLSCVFKVGTEVPPFIDLFFNSQRYFLEEVLDWPWFISLLPKTPSGQVEQDGQLI